MTSIPVKNEKEETLVSVAFYDHAAAFCFKNLHSATLTDSTLHHLPTDNVSISFHRKFQAENGHNVFASR